VGEDMKHDLNAINAALRLGDKFVPPNGSVCRCMNCNAVEMTCEVSIVHTTEDFFYLRLDNNKYVYYNTCECVLEVIWIPKDAPPFGEWVRWMK
jgi:hypothetical protein